MSSGTKTGSGYLQYVWMDFADMRNLVLLIAHFMHLSQETSVLQDGISASELHSIDTLSVIGTQYETMFVCLFCGDIFLCSNAQ